MNILSSTKMIGEGVYQFLVVASILVGSILSDCVRQVDSRRCFFGLQCSIPLILLAAFVFREKILAQYNGVVKDKLSRVIRRISEPPVPRHRSFRSKKSRNSEDMYETESFEELSCSDDLSTLDYSNDNRSAVDWSSRERRIEIARYTLEEIMQKSINDPRILVGWKISMNNGNDVGVILSTIKRKFAATKFSIEMGDGSVEHMKLQRGHNKGTVPFKLLEKVM